MTRERRLNDFLLAVTKSIFQELISMDAVMLKIMVKLFPSEKNETSFLL